MIMDILTVIMSSLDVIGVIIITCGALYALGSYFLGFVGLIPLMSLEQMRLELGRTIVLAVEFMLAADIVKTIVTPDYYEIGMMGALVIIRTVLTYFLNQELVQLQEGMQRTIK